MAKQVSGAQANYKLKAIFGHNSLIWRDPCPLPWAELNEGSHNPGDLVLQYARACYFGLYPKSRSSHGVIWSLVDIFSLKGVNSSSKLRYVFNNGQKLFFFKKLKTELRPRFYHGPSQPYCQHNFSIRAVQQAHIRTEPQTDTPQPRIRNANVASSSVAILS